MSEWRKLLLELRAEYIHKFMFYFFLFLSVISQARNYSLRLLSSPICVIQNPTSLLSRFYDKAMNFYMKDILRIVFHSKDSFGYMAERKACYNPKRYFLLRDMRTHKSREPWFNLEGREKSDFNLSIRYLPD